MCTMERANGRATVSTAIFVGIEIDKISVKAGLASRRYWSTIMQAFRAVNAERFNLPEELLLQIQSYIKAAALPIRDQILEKFRSSRYENRKHFNLSHHDYKILDKDFSLTVYGKYRQYLCIPWDLSYDTSDKTNPKYGKCCKSMTASQEEEVDPTMDCEDSPALAESGTSLVIDQDLSITKEKVTRINRAIQELSLTVVNDGGNNARTTECDVESTAEDLKYEVYASSRGLNMWKPRVILVHDTKLELFNTLKEL